MSSLHVVSNRTASDPTSRAGGLAVAVWEALSGSGGYWLGWSGEINEQAHRGVRQQYDGDVEFVLTDLTGAQHDGYYIGYSNRVIWPVFHYRVDLANFTDDYFPAYREVNERFASLTANRLKQGDYVWAHDYHLLLFAEALRREGWNGPIGFFLHIPFPAPDVFSAIPHHQKIARALCDYDVIGFQSEQDRNNFRRYITENSEAEIDGDKISVFGKKVIAKPYPIGIDPGAFRACIETEPAQAAIKRISRFLGSRALVIGVDRMDYSKGLPERFEAVGRLFDEYPETRQKVSVTQIAPPSRSKVEEYRELRKKLDGLSGRINGDYGDIDWLPLRYLARSYDREELAGLFSIAKVGLVTPLRDGMNLVAKEYVAAQNPEDPGVLVLSEFAGAAEQLPEALLVNPHDTRNVAETVHRALHMRAEERKERHDALWRTINAHDIAWWRNSFLTDLRGAAAQ